MENKLFETTEDSLALIRKKAKEDVVKSDFRRKLIGGISEEDVEDYINMVQLQFQYKENKLNEQIDELISLKDKLRVEFNTYIEKAEQEKKRLSEDLEEARQSLESYTVQSKTTGDQLAEMEKELVELRNKTSEDSVKLVDFEKFKSSNEELKRENDQLKQKLKQMERLLEESENKVQVQWEARKLAEQRLQEVQLNTHYGSKDIEALAGSVVKQSAADVHRDKPKSFNGELNALYKELERVKEQVKENSNLQQQLEQERQKAEKAEREMTDFFKKVLELKDKLDKSN